MKLIKAEVLGYCMGVRRAVEIAYREAENSRLSAAQRGGPVYTMGPLIHNPQVLEELRRLGVDSLDEDALPEDLHGAVVIIRAHGVTPALEAELVLRGARLIDATCPKVKASQMKARALNGAASRIFLAGERHHAEILGIQGFAPGCLIVANREEAAAVAETLFRRLGRPSGSDTPVTGLPKTALIAQTTLSPEEYQAIGEGIAKFFPQVAIFNTICGATRDRQDALKRLCAEVDAVIIVGGRESANTRRLFAIAQAQGKPAWLVESAADISGELAGEIAAYPRVGLSAGASTPDGVIEDIEGAVLAL
ncbi:4-hydroxy-3-methylbut-2-enyl diphosphate reductase [Spirochaetia bacterium]|nr:4-hydroxy-3-methylbut-2-enyl diphosphate reductase [Spirochaetia bacterium]